MRKNMVLIMCCLTLILSGCWDKIEIENRAFILGVAIDRYPPIPGNENQKEKTEASLEEEEKFIRMQLHTSEPVYAMSVQIPIIKKALLTSISGGGGGGGGEMSKTWELTQVGNSFMEMNRELATRTNLIPYYEHIQAIVISEEVAKGGLRNILDFFIRDPEMRRRTKLFISRGEAKKILDVVPRIEDYSSMYLSGISENAKINGRIIHWTDLGEAVQNVNKGLDFLLPLVEGTKDEVKVARAAVFKGDKMVGYTDGLELEAVKLIRNRYKGGVITAQSPDNKSGIIVLELTKAKTKITPIVGGESVKFNLDISVTGNYVENVNMSVPAKINSSYLRNAEKAFKAQIEKQCTDTIKRIQKDFGADIFQFKKILKTKSPAYWEEIKEQWDNIFPGAEVEVNAEVIIRQIGNIK